jgi:hypothetical protein
MTRHVPDDRRYMSYEQRAAEGDERFVVKPKTDAVKIKPPKVVPHAGRTCTVRSISGECGKPAVYAFRATTGEVFAECAEHH